MKTKRKTGPRPDENSIRCQSRAVAAVLGIAWQTVRAWSRLPGGIAAGLRRYHLIQEARALGRRSE